MAQFNPDAQRLDPYKNFKFRLKWNGKYVAGMSKCSAFMGASEIGQPHESSDLCSGRKSPGRTKYEAITLEQGLTHDTDFEQWANQVRSVEAGLGGDDSRKHHKNLVIEVYNEAGQLTMAYKVHHCWVSEFLALPDFDARANAFTIQYLKLENEGWERALESDEPSGLTFANPS